MPEIDLHTNDRDREISSADREACICEEGHARGFEEAADGCVVAMAKRVEIREPNTVLDPVTIERRLKRVRGGHRNLMCPAGASTVPQPAASPASKCQNSTRSPPLSSRISRASSGEATVSPRPSTI